MCVYKLGRKVKLTKDKYYWKIFTISYKTILPMFSSTPRYKYKKGLNKAVMVNRYIGCGKKPYKTGFFCFKTKLEAEGFLDFCGFNHNKEIKRIIIKKGTIIQHSYDKMEKYHRRSSTYGSSSYGGTMGGIDSVFYKTRAIITPELII